MEIKKRLGSRLELPCYVDPVKTNLGVERFYQ